MTKKDQSSYLLFELGDASGRMKAILWENIKPVIDSIQIGDIVKVKGKVVVYKDQHQINIENIRKAEPQDGKTKKAFLPKGEINVDQLVRGLRETIDSVKNGFLQKLLYRVFDHPLYASPFKEAPGGKLWHHAYLGGLLEHTMAVVAICKTMADLYPAVNRDLLMAGALLHDLGKLKEYRYDQGFIDYSDEGRLWGHISIGAQWIRKIIEELEDDEAFSLELKKHLIHLILSHQGELEHGSPVVPMTLEAIILYYADEMDSKANALQHIIDRDREPGRAWSKYIPVIDRFIYLRSQDASGEEPGSASETEETPPSTLFD